MSSLIYLEPPCGPSLDTSFTLLLLGADRFGNTRHCHLPVLHHCRFFYGLRQPSYLFMFLDNMIS